MSPLVYIILVNYNGVNDTIECINSLEKIKYDNYKIVVVDNASSDNSYEILESKYPMHRIIKSEKNLGFAGGNNIGIKLALKDKAEFVLLLNNDTVVEEEFLINMVSCFEKSPKIGIVGGKILLYEAHDIISHAGGSIDMLKFTTAHYGMNCKEDHSEFNFDKEVTFVSGCLMLIKGEIFQRVGLLSEEYFMYYEDTDFCLKTQDMGYKLWYTPLAKIYHKVSKSSGGEDSPFFIKWNTRNRIILMNKYKGRVNRASFILSEIYVYSTRLIRYAQYVFKRDRARAKAIKEGIIEARVMIKH